MQCSSRYLKLIGAQYRCLVLSGHWRETHQQPESRKRGFATNKEALGMGKIFPESPELLRPLGDVQFWEAYGLYINDVKNGLRESTFGFTKKKSFLMSLSASLFLEAWKWQFPTKGVPSRWKCCALSLKKKPCFSDCPLKTLHCRLSPFQIHTCPFPLNFHVPNPKQRVETLRTWDLKGNAFYGQENTKKTIFLDSLGYYFLHMRLISFTWLYSIRGRAVTLTQQISNFDQGSRSQSINPI